MNAARLASVLATFSILYRIEWVETSGGVLATKQLKKLSVSCIGSNGLKHEDELTVVAIIATFSILYRIEWVETGKHEFTS